MGLGDAMTLCNYWVMDGIGFGSKFPEEAVSIWSQTYGRTNEDRLISQQRGIPLTDEMKWEYVELGVIEDLTEFIIETFPDLLEPLGLTATSPS